MDKRLFIQVQGGRKVSGILRGFDIFLNIVLDEALEETTPGQKLSIGQVVSRMTFQNISLIRTRLLEAIVYCLWNHWRLQDDP